MPKVCDEIWPMQQYVCGDTTTSGYGYSGKYFKATEAKNEKSCREFCEEFQSTGCCELRIDTCFYKPTGIVRYAKEQTRARAIMCNIFFLNAKYFYNYKNLNGRYHNLLKYS